MEDCTGLQGFLVYNTRGGGTGSCFRCMFLFLTALSDFDFALYVDVAMFQTNFVVCRRIHFLRCSYPRIITKSVGEAQPPGIAKYSATKENVTLAFLPRALQVVCGRVAACALEPDLTNVKCDPRHGKYTDAAAVVLKGGDARVETTKTEHTVRVRGLVKNASHAVSGATVVLHRRTSTPCGGNVQDEVHHSF